MLAGQFSSNSALFPRSTRLAAIASRTAVKTEAASKSGGSPMALELLMPWGKGASFSSSTRKSVGICLASGGLYSLHASS